MERNTNNFGQVTCLWICLVLMSTTAVASPTCVLGDFEQQVAVVWRHIRMSPEQHRDMARVVRDLTDTIHKQYPGWRIEQFGSTAMGLELKWSDGDFFVFTSNSTKIDKDNGTMINTAKRAIEHRPDLFNGFQILDNLMCPILEFVHIPTDILVHVTFSVPVIVPELIAHLIHLDVRFFQMAVMIKYWSYVHLIVDCPVCIPSYAMTILVIFFLQQKNMLPPVANLQTNIEPVLINKWNTAFDHLQYHPNNNETLYDLLGGFFKYYSNFDFEQNVVSVYCGCVIKKNEMENVQLSEAFSTYSNNVRMGYAEPFSYGFINIQDVFLHNYNLGRPWYDRSLLDRLISHAKFAAHVYEIANRYHFLLTILKTHKYEDTDLLSSLWSKELDVSKACLDEV